MTPEVIAALATAIVSIIGAIAALLAAKSAPRTAAGVAHVVAQAEITNHFLKDHLSAKDIQDATGTSDNSPETPDTSRAEGL